MSNEFDYKKYLKNNPLLKEEETEETVTEAKFKMVKIGDEYVEPLVSAILDLSKSEDRFQDIVSFAKWMFQPEMRTTTIPEKAADGDSDFETDLTRILNNSDRLYTIMQLAWKKYKNSSEITEEASPEFDKLTDQAEEDYESGMEVKDIISKIPDEYKDKVEQHLRLKMGDY